MTVVIRIILYIIAGYLLRGGWIPEDVAEQISNNEELVLLLEAGVGVVVTAGTVLWWRLAKRWGWKT